MAFPSYATGTVAVANGATVVNGTGTIWLSPNARAGDDIIINGHMVIVEDVTDAEHLVIDPWPYDSVAAGASYKIVQRSPLRFAGGQAMADVQTLVAALRAEDFYIKVPSTATVPDPSLGEEDQQAFQPTTGKLWVKTGGVWVYLGIYKGFNLRGAYDNAASYGVGDVVSVSGTTYVWINAASGADHAPPDPAYWQVLAAKGETGDVGARGAGYGGTSATALAIGMGSKAFTTQAGLAYQDGARVRATATTDATKWMEGVATYADTTLTINASKINGAGTFASWNFNVVGEPGAGDLSSANALSELAGVAATARANIGAGDLLSGNNGSDFDDVDAALSNLHGLSFSVAQALTAAQQAQARANAAAAASPASWTRTVLTAGSGTYAPRPGCKAILVRMCGGGSGGQGNSSAGPVNVAPGAGSDTTFGSSFLIAGGGRPSLTGAYAPNGIAGVATGGDLNVTGGWGGGGIQIQALSNTQTVGGQGGASVFGSGGHSLIGSAGQPGLAYGSGGGGAALPAAGGVSGAGGNAGAYLEKLIVNPAASYAYSVGAGGIGGIGVSSNGGNGAGGIIVIDEFD
jgi:hypothetical protein